LLVAVVSLLPCLLTRAAGTRSGNAARAVPVRVQTGRGHQFVCTDDTQGKIFIVSAQGKVEWQYLAPKANDIWVLPGDNLLFSIDHGVKEVMRDTTVTYLYLSKSAVYGCQRLAVGNTFIGECNTGRLLEVTADGSRIVKEIHLLPDGVDGGPDYMRGARRLENGNYLVAHFGLEVVREYDATGKVVREIPAAGGPYSAARLPDGNTLISCGDKPGGRRIFEVDSNNKTVWQVEGDELPGISLKFVAGFQRQPNGNTVLCNWLGHNRLSKAPHVIEVTPDKKVVWKFSDHIHMKTIAGIQLLDVPGDVTIGEILR